jgi:hypothetical protein
MEENKTVVEETTKKEQPIKDDKVEKLKVKRKPKKMTSNNEPVKLDLNKKEEVKEEVAKVDLTEKKEDADKKQETTDVATDQQTEALQEVVEEVPSGEETVQDSKPVVEEVKEEEVKEEVKAEETKVEPEEPKQEIPENIMKVMKFMEETGGNLEDYVNLNRDVSNLDDQDALLEYYRDTKPHLTLEEINFMMEDQFSYDEENMEEREIKRKKLALKEQVANARKHLDGLKSKYYEEVKARDKRLTPEQQKAVDFFNRYNKEQEQTNKSQKMFLNQTNQVFNKDFKGFEYNVGDKKFRLNINDVAQVKELQSDSNNLFKKFLNENNVMQDARGYHKSIYTAMNPDVIAKHFYEQGKADAIKAQVAKDKNITVNPRSAQNEFEAGGIKFKVLGNDSNSLKVKMRKRN